jgi:hypothetical protein
MAKAAIVVLADTGTEEGMGRVVNALETAREFEETPGDEVQVVFDGAGTRWIPELADPDHDYNHLFERLRDQVSVCGFCSSAFDVEGAVAGVRVARVTSHDSHPEIRDLVHDGYQVITF